MNYSTIKHTDIANGVGVRVSLFVSGCRHHCGGCFNAETWPFDAGRPFDGVTLADILRSLEPDHIDGLSILGGEPLEPENQRDVMYVVDAVRRVFPDKSVWMWTGFTWDELTIIDSRARTSMLPLILERVDVLVDGRFILEDRDITLRFRGSPNQRIIDVRQSLEAGRVVDWQDDPICRTRKWAR